jgi:hypothetical protein
MIRNTKWRVFAFNRVTAAPVLGDANNITAKIAIDYASPTALTDTNPTEAEDGYYYFDLTTEERTGDFVELFPESSTADVQVIGVPGYLSATATSGGGGGGGKGIVQRAVNDLTPILFTFPTGSVNNASFSTKTLRINGGAEGNITGAISYLYELDGKYWYRLAYHASDRPVGDGVVQYLISDGSDTVSISLAVGMSQIATDATTTATEIAKVPRASTAMAGGDDFAWNAVLDTTDKLTLNITDEE